MVNLDVYIDEFGYGNMIYTIEAYVPNESDPYCREWVPKEYYVTKEQVNERLEEIKSTSKYPDYYRTGEYVVGSKYID